MLLVHQWWRCLKIPSPHAEGGRVTRVLFPPGFFYPPPSPFPHTPPDSVQCLRRFLPLVPVRSRWGTRRIPPKEETGKGKSGRPTNQTAMSDQAHTRKRRVGEGEEWRCRKANAPCLGSVRTQADRPLDDQHRSLRHFDTVERFFFVL